MLARHWLWWMRFGDRSEKYHRTSPLFVKRRRRCFCHMVVLTLSHCRRRGHIVSRLHFHSCWYLEKQRVFLWWKSLLMWPFIFRTKLLWVIYRCLDLICTCNYCQLSLYHCAVELAGTQHNAFAIQQCDIIALYTNILECVYTGDTSCIHTYI